MKSFVIPLFVLFSVPVLAAQQPSAPEQALSEKLGAEINIELQLSTQLIVERQHSAELQKQVDDLKKQVDDLTANRRSR